MHLSQPWSPYSSTMGLREPTRGKESISELLEGSSGWAGGGVEQTCLLCRALADTTSPRVTLGLWGGHGTLLIHLRGMGSVPK